MPLLSLVTVTRDDPSGFAQTLASTAEWLKTPAVEQIVVDASEPAATASVSPVRIIRQQPKGIASAFNEGTRATRGEWIWFLNGGDRIDSRLSPDFLLSLLRSTSASVVIGGLTYGDETNPQFHLPPSKQWPPLIPWIPHPAAIVRKSLFDRFGLFDERYRIAMDYEWWL